MRRLTILLLLLATPAFADRPVRVMPTVEVLVDGGPTPEYVAYGTRYIEAVRGRPYSVRLRNPFGVRVAVALSVDGLNSIDARHTDARSAQKWVLEPYETITIDGWQTSLMDARRFFFTTEDSSYAKWMGKTEEMGVISAVFFRERQAPPPRPVITPGMSNQGARDSAGVAGRAQAAPSASAKESARPEAAQAESAATGIGERIEHRVERIHMDLEDRPATIVTLRYEYRPQLVRLGILPSPGPYYQHPTESRKTTPSPAANGFCPQP